MRFFMARGRKVVNVAFSMDIVCSLLIIPVVIFWGRPARLLASPVVLTCCQVVLHQRIADCQSELFRYPRRQGPKQYFDSEPDR